MRFVTKNFNNLINLIIYFKYVQIHLMVLHVFAYLDNALQVIKILQSAYIFIFTNKDIKV